MITILAVSDSISWISFEDVIKNITPDITVFSGDLVSDGYAQFWKPPWEIAKKIEDENNLKKDAYFMDSKFQRLWLKSE